LIIAFVSASASPAKVSTALFKHPTPLMSDFDSVVKASEYPSPNGPLTVVTKLFL